MTNTDQTEPGKLYVWHDTHRGDECSVCGLLGDHYHPEGWQKPNDLVVGLPESASGVQVGSKMTQGQQPEDGELVEIIGTLVHTYLAKVNKPRNDTELQAYNAKVSKLEEVAVSKLTAWADRRADRRSQAVSVDELLQDVDEILAFGYKDPTFIHDIHVLIGGEERVATARAAIQSKITEAYEKGLNRE